jgi:uncharacterized membrane protein YdjX (TVP38/TMEM64 family)
MSRDPHTIIDTHAAPGAAQRSWLVRLAALAVILAAALLLPLMFDTRQILQWLAGWEQQLRGAYHEHPVLMLTGAFALYVAVTSLSLPFALPLSLTYGWLFGFVPAVLVVTFASTSGATISFLLARYLIGDWVQRRFGDKLVWFNAAVERDGAFFLFTLRLVPAVPFWLVNLLAGMTKIRATTFWWVSQLGMLPGTLVFIYAGSQVATVQEIADRGIWGFVRWQLFVALALLASFPLLAKWVIDRLRKRATPGETLAAGEPGGSPAKKL